MEQSAIILCVLPFTGSGGVENDLFHHFEEDLAYHLSKFQGLAVLSYQTTSQLSLNDFDKLDRFKVTHMVSGSYRKVQEKVILSVQLVAYPTNVVVYDQRVAIADGAIFKHLDDTILQVVNTLQIRLERALLSRSYTKPEVSLEAYDFFFAGANVPKGELPEG